MLLSSVLSGFVQKDVRVPLVRVPKTTTIGQQEMNKICCMAMTASCLACSSGKSIQDYCEAHPETSGCPEKEGKTGCCKAFLADCEACRKGITTKEFCTKEPKYLGCPWKNEKEDFENSKEACKDVNPRKCKKLAHLCKKPRIYENCKLTCGLCKPLKSSKVDESSDTCQLPLDTISRCRARVLRYYFNSATSQCDTFYYGGCDGNKNNFETYEECEKLCMGARTLKQIKQEGDACGPCFCPPSFTMGECDEGLSCVKDEMIPDAPGRCKKI